MTSKSRASRREAARHQRQTSASRWLLPIGALALGGVAVLAILLSQGGSTGAAVVSPSASAASSEGLTGPPVITGSPLPKFTTTANDSAVGLTAPVVHGHDYSGAPVSIAPTGKPMMVLFAAHWCPHCQREVPLIQAWIDSGKAPTDVDMISVSTAIDPTLPNYPPEAWFASVHWTLPVIVDSTNSVAQAYGLNGYPFFVILDGSGKVYERLGGEIPISQLESVLAAVPRS